MPKGVYIRTKECRENLSKSHKGKIPWIKNKYHTDKSKQKMSSFRLGKSPSNKGVPMSKEKYDKCSKTFFKKGAEGPNKGKHIQTNTGRTQFKKGQLPSPKSGFGKRYFFNSCFQGKICLRSSYEFAYAKYLDSKNIKWYYEFQTFDVGSTTYTPDFFIPEKNLWIEIKGWMRPNHLEKIKKFKEKYPEKKFIILFKEDLENLGINL